MKKILLIGVAALTALSSVALNPDKLTKRLNPAPANDLYSGIQAVEVGPGAGLKAPATRAEGNELDFTLAGEPYQAIRLNVDNKLTKHMGFEFNAQNATVFAGNQISAISLCTGVNSITNKNAIKKATVYLTYDLTEEPFYSQEFDLGNGRFTFYQCELDKPYTIEAGKAVFVMCKFTNPSSKDYYIPVDGLQHENDEGGWIGIENEDGTVKWDNLWDTYGYICMKALITGSKIPTDGASIYGYNVQAYVEPGKNLDILVGVNGALGGEIQDVEIKTTVAGETPVVGTYPVGGLAFNEKQIVEISNVPCSTQGLDVPVKIEITKVNGKPNNVTAAVQGRTMCFDKSQGFSRNVLIEEATGCWCGWCPRGIVLLEKLREKYTDGTVAIAAVHNGDEMAVTECQAFLYAYVSGFPTMIVNRAENCDFTEAAFENLYAYFRGMPAPGVMTLTAAVDEDDSKVTVSGISKYALDASGANRFLLSFYLTQDGMGPYDQTNYYSGGSYGPLEGFDDKPESTPVIYNDVARTIYDFPGISNSVPAEIKGGQEYAYSYDISLENVTSQNFNVIGMIVDGYSGEILNTIVIPAKKHSSVKGVNVDKNGLSVAATDGCLTLSGVTAPVKVFTVDGRCVASANADCSLALPAGLYLVNSGAKTVKVRL